MAVSRVRSKKASRLNLLKLMVVITSLWGVWTFGIEPLTAHLFLSWINKSYPEVLTVYQAERERFPQYSVGVVRNVLYPVIGDTNPESQATITYVVTLESQFMSPPEDDVKAAGRLACESGLPPGTNLVVVSRRQYYYLPFYFARNYPGYCP